MRRAVVPLLAALTALLLFPSASFACSTDANSWFETFIDSSSCVQSTTNVEFDPLGGLRLDTTGPVTTTPWDASDDFTSPDNGPSTIGFPRVGISTLAVNNALFPASPGDPAGLELPAASLALSRDVTTLPPTPPGQQAVPSALDAESVSDPAVIKVGSEYWMYYSGYAEDGSGPAIFLAKSTDGGTVFTKLDGADADTHADALVGPGSAAAPAPGDFDERGAFGPDVVYDPADPAAPYKMWYSGRGPVFGSIGYATSTNGVDWTRADGNNTGAGDTTIDAVLDHGRPGAADAFTASDPSVMKDAGVWKLWYTGDDSDIKRIAYATAESPQGPWRKGGTVIDASGGNFEFGAFAPSVYKDGSTFKAWFVGRKEVGSGQGDFQTKIISGSSSDGIAWSGFSIAQNPNGTFSSENLDAPEILPEDGSLKTWWSGNTCDGCSLRIVRGSTLVVGLGIGGDAFDSRSASGASFVKNAAATPNFVGAYWGTRSKSGAGVDSRPRLGLVKSTDGADATKVAGPGPAGSLLADGGANDFNVGGERDPALTLEGTTYRVYFTGIEGSVETIGAASSLSSDVNGLPATWSDPGAGANAQPLLDKGSSGFDVTGVSQPYVVKDGADYVMFYTANAGGVLSIGRVTSTTPTSGFTGRAQVLSPQAGTFEKDGIKDPVVWKDGGGTWHMLYTAVERFDEDGDGLADRVYERSGHATASSATGAFVRDASPFTLGPSQDAGSPDEHGSSAQGALVDGTTTHVWYSGSAADGRLRGRHATNDSAAPPPSSSVPNGFATYQFGNDASGARAFRQIVRDSTGSVELWMSVLQPYSPKAGKDYWSDYFPVAVDPGTSSEQLDLLLSIQGVRWQARLRRSATPAALDRVALEHAPVQFVPSGSARTDVITPPSGQNITDWSSAEVQTRLYGSGGAGGTVHVLNTATDTEVASAPLNVGNTGSDATTSIDLAGLSVAANPTLRLVFDLTSSPPGSASPLITSAKVSYFTNVSPKPPVPPPPPPVITLATTTPVVTFGQRATLSGNLSQGGAALAGVGVSLLEQPLGAAAFTALPGATTDGAGNYTSLVSPQKKTVYKASFAGAAAEPVVTVAVNHLVTLKVVRKRGKGTFSGKVGPVHAGKVVTIQQLKSGRWVSFASAKTGSLSTFRTVKKLSMKAKYRFRARTLADAEHGEGLSPVAFVDKHKVTLATKLSGKTITFSGKVSPNHKGKLVLIKQLVGTRFATIAKVKLSARSTFSFKKKFKAGAYQLRADLPADKLHFAGQSPVRTVTVK